MCSCCRNTHPAQKITSQAPVECAPPCDSGIPRPQMRQCPGPEPAAVELVLHGHAGDHALGTLTAYLVHHLPDHLADVHQQQALPPLPLWRGRLQELNGTVSEDSAMPSPSDPSRARVPAAPALFRQGRLQAQPTQCGGDGRCGGHGQRMMSLHAVRLPRHPRRMSPSLRCATRPAHRKASSMSGVSAI